MIGAINLRPCGEVVGFDVETAVSLLALLIVIARVQIQIWPTVTVQLADLLPQVAVMVASPLATAVTSPVVLSTVATAGVSLAQVGVLPSALTGSFTAES